MKTAAALCLAMGVLCASAAPELVFQSSSGASHCNVHLQDGVLVSSCDFTHGKTGFASLQADVEGLKAENAALRSEAAAHRAETAALRTELVAAIHAISLTPGAAGANGKDGAQGTPGSRGPTGPAGAIPNMSRYVKKNRAASFCCM